MLQSAMEYEEVLILAFVRATTSSHFLVFMVQKPLSKASILDVLQLTSPIYHRICRVLSPSVMVRHS